MRLAGAFLAAVLLASQALAQQYPAKPVRMILTVSGGGEANARLIAEEMSRSLGVPVVVEGQTGAGGSVAVLSVVRAAPDGYTILYGTTDPVIVRRFLVKNLAYDVLKDLTPIAYVGAATLSLVAHPSFPADSLRDLIEHARRNPGKVTYGSTGIGTAHHLSGVLLEQLTGVRMVHVPYKNGPQSVTDLVGGRIHLLFGVMSTFTPLVDTGKVKLIAINGPERYRPMPEVPTMVEIVPGFERPPSWIGTFGPAGLPQPIVRRLSDEVVKAASNAQVKARVESGGTLLGPMPTEKFAPFVKANVDLAAKLTAAAGIELE